MANNISPSKVIYYISQKRKILVGRNNQVNQDLLKFDYRVTDKFNFQVVNSINQIIPPTSTKYELFGSYVDNKQQLHILFFAQNDPVTGNTIPFTVDTYTSEFMNYVKIEKEIDLTIVAVNPDNENDKSMVLRDRALVYPRPYIQGRVPTQILQRTILSFNNPVSGLFAAGSNFAYIDRTVNNFSLGEGLYTDTENQLVIGSYNEPSGTTNKAFVIGNGEDNSNRSNAFTVDYQGNVEAKSITVDGQNVGDKVNQLENAIETVSAAIPSVEGFATEQWVQDQGYLTAHQSLNGYATEQWVQNQGYLTAHQSLNGYATEQWVQNQGYLTAHQDLTAYATKNWVEGKGYITGVNLDPYATKDQLTAYATKSDLTVSASVLSNQISQLALNIPTKVSDLTNDAGYLTAVPSSYALKTDIPTGNAQLQNTAGYITGYNAGTGISISNGTISLTGEVGKTYYADNNTLQLNNTTNTFSIKSLSSKLNQGTNVILTTESDGSVTINAIGGGGGGTGGATYLAGLGLNLSTVSAEDGIYKFYVNEPWLDNKINTATSGIQNLSAGTGLEIEDNVISLTAEIPSIDGLASEQWVETNFLSAIPSNYATKDYVDSSVSGKADLSSVYTKEEVYTYIETDAKINEATSGKADKSELSDYATEADLQIVSAAIPSLVGYATESYVTQQVSGKANSADVYTKTEVYTKGETDSAIETASASIINQIPSVQGLASEQYVDNAVSTASGNLQTAINGKTTSGEVKTQIQAYGYQTATDVANAITGKADKSELTAYALSSQVYSKTEVDTISSNIVSQIPSVEGLATESYVQTEIGKIDIPTNTSDLTNDSGFITSADIPTSYVQQSELESVSGQLTNAIGAKANTTQVEAEFTATSAWANETFLTEHQSLSSYYTKSEVDSAIGTATNDMATQSWVEEQGYLTAHQSLDNYYNKTEVDTALALKADSADVYTKTEVNNISTNIVSQIPTDVATSAYVQAASGNAVSVATGWVGDQNYLTEVPSEYITETELATELEPYAQSTDVTTAITNATSGKADQSTVESLSANLSAAITGVVDSLSSKANVSDVYTKTEVYTKGETDSAINTATSGKADKSYVDSTFLSASQIADYYTSAQVETRIIAETSGKVNKTDFDTVTGALSSAIDIKTTSGEVKTQIEAYGYQNATDVANAISGKADKSELQSVSGTLSTAISGVSDRVGTVEADYIKSADMTATSTWINNTFETKTNVNNLTGRVKAIEDDYTTSAYVTGQVNNLATGAVATNTTNIGQLSTDLGTVSGKANANETNIGTLSTDLGTANGNISTLSTDLSTVSGKANTNADNISSLSTRIGTANGNITTLSTDLGTVSGDVDTLKNQAVTSSYLTSYVNNQFVAVSQLANDVGYITAGDLPEGTVYLAGEGLKLQNAVFSLTGTVLSGDGSTIAINNNVISVIGGGSGGKTYTGGTGIEVDNTNDTISLTATIPTKTSDLTNDSGFITAIPTTYVQKSEISDMATQTWVGQQGYLTNIPTSYALKTDVQTAISSSSGAIVDAATGAITVPTKTSDLTNDSGFATSAQVSSIVTGYNYITGITVSYNDEEWTEYTLSGKGISFADDVYFEANESNDIVNVVWKGVLIAGGSESIEMYSKRIDWSGDFRIEDWQGDAYISLANPVPLSTSQLTNDSGYTTSAVVSAIASAYAQGGGGGFEYTSLTPSLLAVDNTNHTLSAATQSGGGGGSTNLIAGNRIRLTETAQGTRIDVLDYKVSANNQTFDFDWRNGVETSALVYQYEGDYPIQATFNPILPNGITFNNGIFTATSGATVTNGTSVISATIFAEDAVEKTIETTFNTVGFINAEISASTITSFVFDANNAETISAFTWDVVSGTPQNLTVEISGDLPEGITSALSIQNRTLTFTGTSDSFEKNSVTNLQVAIDGDNIERTVVTLQLTIQNVVVRKPLTFTGKSASNAIALTQTGTPSAITLQYSKNGGEWAAYTVGDIIEFNQNQLVSFKGNNDHFSKDDNNYYKFQMTGSIEANGSVQSLMNYSDSVTNYCYDQMFSGCTSLTTPPSLPATTLAERCYKNMFRGCNSLLSAPQLPATTLAIWCYMGMFLQCSSLTGAPTLPATTLANYCYACMFMGCSNLLTAPFLPATSLANDCYEYMFQGCSKLSSIEVAFTNWQEYTYYWLGDVAANGTFTCPTALGTNQTISRGSSKCPKNWTVVNK